MEDLLLAVRVVLALAVVLGAIFWLKRRVGVKAGQGNTALTVVVRRSISPKASVAVVDFDGRRLLLGVTDTAVNVLTDVPQPAAQFDAAMEKANEGARSEPAVEGQEAPAEQGPLAGSIFAKSSWTSMAAAISGGKK